VLLFLHSASRQPIKLTLHMSRHATLDQVVVKALQLYNAYEADCTSSCGALALRSCQETANGAKDGIRGAPLARSSSKSQSQSHGALVHQQSLSLKSSTLTDGVAGQTTEPSAATTVKQCDSTNPTPAQPPVQAHEDSASQQVTEPAPQPVAKVTSLPPPPPPASQAQPLVPPLVAVNTIVIDVNDKQRGRFGKMLDKR
jgi:hypothetical protein